MMEETISVDEMFVELKEARAPGKLPAWVQVAIDLEPGRAVREMDLSFKNANHIVQSISQWARRNKPQPRIFARLRKQPDGTYTVYIAKAEANGP